MVYCNKHNAKIIKRMRRLADKADPTQKQEKNLARHLAGLSRGGELERSHKKMVGNVARRNVAKKYDVINKAHDRVEMLLMHKNKAKARGIL
jgi:hypothetical protein